MARINQLVLDDGYVPSGDRDRGTISPGRAVMRVERAAKVVGIDSEIFVNFFKIVGNIPTDRRRNYWINIYVHPVSHDLYIEEDAVNLIKSDFVAMKYLGALRNLRK